MNRLIRERSDGRRVVALPGDARVLFLFRDPERILKQLHGKRSLHVRDLDPADLLDDINTDVMTPAWVCFRHDPAEIAADAYAGLLDAHGGRVFPSRALLDGGFRVIVSGARKGTGSSREAAAQAEKWAGIDLVVASSFAPIHWRNHLNLGTLASDHAVLARLQDGEEVPLDEITDSYDPISRAVLEAGGLFAFVRRVRDGDLRIPEPETGSRPMTMAEKLIASHRVGADGPAWVRPGDACVVCVDGGYSHEFTSAQVHHFLRQEFGDDYRAHDPSKLAVFEDHLLFADGAPQMAPFAESIESLRRIQREFQAHTGVRDHSSRDGVSPGICHQVAREEFVDPGDLIQATDSHTCMAGGNNALGWGVGSTEYAASVVSGLGFVQVPESIRFELLGRLDPSCTAKDVMLHILKHYAAREATLDRVMEFGGPGLAALDMDERATLANMAAECSARSAICEGDEVTAAWLAARRPGNSLAAIRARFVNPDPDADYAGGVHRLDLGAMVPMVARPGDPTYGTSISELPEIPIDIAYAGSCTAGKEADLDHYARVLGEALDADRSIASGVTLFLQFGSQSVRDYAREHGHLEIFRHAGVRLLDPGCGACIGCGPGVSERPDQVTVSAINRNYSGRSGPGQVYLASPLSVAASAVEGRIASYRPGMFAG